MSARRVRRTVSDAAETIIPFAANATNSVPHSKILHLRVFAALLFLGAFAALLVVVAVPILSRADMPPVPTSSTLKCYDSAEKYEPCVTQASASQSRFNGRTTGADQAAGWTRTALYQAHQPPSWTRTALYQAHQPPSWTRTALYQAHQPPSWTRTALYQAHQPANLTTSAPAARHSSTSRKHPALAICARRLIPCFLSALRRRLTHIASVAATVGQARPAREHP